MIKISDKIKSISTLISGAIISQLIGIIATFILARIYAPDAFGVFGSSLAICTILSVIVVLKFELTVIFPKTSLEAKLCSFVSFAFAFSLSTATIFILSIAGATGLLSLDFSASSYGALVFLIAFEQISVSWLIRIKSFKYITVISVIKALAIAILQIYLSDSDGGLWKGYLYGNGLAAAFYFYVMLEPLIDGYKCFSIHRLFYFVKKYRKFPTFSLPAGVMNTMGNQIPILLIRSLFGEQYAGYYLLIRKIILAPILLFSTNINKVLAQEVSHNIAHNKAYLESVIYYIKLSSALSFGVFIAVLAFLYFDGIVFLMGKTWEAAELLAYILMPYAFISFIARSVSRFAIYGKNEWGLYYQFVYVILTVLTLYLTSKITANFTHVLTVYSLTLCFMYTSQILLVLRIAHQHKKAVSLS